MATKRILILAGVDDAHAAAVCRELDDTPVDFFRYDELVNRYAVAYTINESESVRKFYSEEQTLDLNTYTAIWHRRPYRVKSFGQPEEWISQMIENESQSALDALFQSLSCLWMNLPARDFACMQKLWQLESAKKLGFSVPETLVTSDAQLVMEFYERCHGEVIYKLINERTHSLIPAFELPRGITTLPLRAKDLPYLNQVCVCPHLFQRKIHKKADLRITVVGHRIFAIEIDSQSGGGAIDWRTDYSVDMKAFVLPAEVQQKCLALMRHFGLNYGALDMVLTPEGDFVFIEINCAGQYLWIEEKTDLKISAEIANLLTGRSEPLTNA